MSGVRTVTDGKCACDDSETHEADTVRSLTELALVEFHATRIGCT